MRYLVVPAGACVAADKVVVVRHTRPGRHQRAGNGSCSFIVVGRAGQGRRWDQHLVQPCPDHSLDVARQGLEVDGQPYPLTSTYSQATKTMAPFQLRVRTLYTRTQPVPFTPLSIRLGPPPASDVHLGEVRTQYVGSTRRPLSPEFRTTTPPHRTPRAQRAGSHTSRAKCISTRSGASSSSYSDSANLERLRLNGNELSGCVPSSLQGRLDMDYSDLGDLPFCP